MCRLCRGGLKTNFDTDYADYTVGGGDQVERKPVSRRGAEKGMFGRLRRKGKSAKNIGIRTRADPLALTGGTELDNGLKRKIAFC
jgi:hypothetical protein